MASTPPVRFARREDYHIAYTVTGEGPLELVYLLGFVSHLDLLWEEPRAAQFFERLGQFCRLVLIDKRGTGLSDRVGDVPIVEDQVDDLLAVLDDVGFERPTFLGTQDSFLVAAWLAATRPERVRSLIGFAVGDPRPSDWTDDELRRFFGGLEKYWGREDAPMNFWANHLWKRDPSFRRWWARYSRSAAGPATAVRVVRNYLGTDLSSILPSISVPTLIAYPHPGPSRSRSTLGNYEIARRLSDKIPGAQFVDLSPGTTALLPWFDGGEETASVIEEFLTGVPGIAVPDRVLSTVLFTDIVGSTERAAALGDGTWRRLLDHHDATIEQIVQRYGGRLVKFTGDGLLATFDGPSKAVMCARVMMGELHVRDIHIRAGVHTGEIEIRGGSPQDVTGVGVVIASRICDLADTEEVLVSRTVKDLVSGSNVQLDDRGEHQLKGLDEPWRLYAATTP